MMGWRWDGEVDGFVIQGPLAAEHVTRVAGWFPPDAPVVWEVGGQAETLPFEAFVDRGSIPQGVRVTLPGNPTGVGSAAYVMARLLSERGCPWDRAQTPRSLIRYLLDEPFEAAAAILAEQWDLAAEELGDVLLQVLFQAALQERAGRWGLEDVARGLAAKLVRRHPHVFGDAPAHDVLGRWEAMKAREVHAVGDERVMPGLMALGRALKRGFKPPRPELRDTFQALAAQTLAENPDDARPRLVSMLAGLILAARQAHLEPEWVVWEALAEHKSP
jgi:NTP pyrophosphatase (non-canonical NTP hydrolase)